MHLKKWVLLLHCWVLQYPAKDVSEEAMVDNSTACDVYNVVTYQAFFKATTLSKDLTYRPTEEKKLHIG